MAGFPGSRPIFQANAGFPGALPVFQASAGFPGALPVFQASAGFPGALPVFQASAGFPGARPVFQAGCFPKYELVNTSTNEHIQIGSLKVGDKISSWDMDRKKVGCTSVNEIHKYVVKEIICFNNIIRVSSSHPLLVMECRENNIFVPKWKVAFDVDIGDFIVGSDCKIITINIKSNYWYTNGIEVLNLSTDNGAPFFVGNIVVRANNAFDNIDWSDTLVTQKMQAA